MILLNLVWGCAIFVLLFIISFGSYCLLRRPVRSEGRTSKTGLVVSLSNCFSCGVFLSACFLGLLPHVREQEEHIRNVLVQAGGDSDSSSHIFLNAELIVLIGFLLILLVEEIVHSFQESKSRGTVEHCARAPQISTNGKASKTVLNITGGDVSSTHNSSFPTLLSWDEDTEPLVSDNLSTEDFADEANNTPKIEFRRISDEVAQAHSHGGHSHAAFLSSSISLSSFALLLGLSTHSVFEGIALGMQRSLTEFYSVLIAIMLHEVLCSFAFGVSLAQQKAAPKTALIASVILASSIPVGMSSSIVISSMESFNGLLCRFILEGIAAGTFIYVACVEMLSSELKAHEQGTKAGLSKAVAVIVGVFTFLFITTAFGHRRHMSSSSPLHTETLSTTPHMETNQ